MSADPVDDIVPPPRCKTCGRPLDVTPVARGSLILAFLCVAHGPQGTIDARQALDDENDRESGAG